MRCRLRHLTGILAGTLALASPAAASGRLAVAAAANLVFVLKPLDAAFEAADPGVAVAAEIGSSGSLVAQIGQGAPYDVFLSADMDYPRALIRAGGADASSLVAFAYGRLVLWTTRPGPGFRSIASAVRDPALRTIAVANPRTAPYGRAAEQALGRLGLAAAAGPKLVFAENIAQTAEYVSTGNADAGFVALSLVLSPKLANRGRWIEVPPSLYEPIAQGAVVTRRGEANPDARRYVAFLGTPAARALFARFGYGLP